MAIFVVLGFVLLFAWMAGVWAMPGAGPLIHVPLLLALACFGAAALRRGPKVRWPRRRSAT